MGRVEDIINAAKTNEMLSELLHYEHEPRGEIER